MVDLISKLAPHFAYKPALVSTLLVCFFLVACTHSVNLSRSELDLSEGNEKNGDAFVVLSRYELLQQIEAVILEKDDILELAVAVVSSEQVEYLERILHESGRPGEYRLIFNASGKSERDIRNSINPKNYLDAVWNWVKTNEEYALIADAYNKKLRKTKRTNEHVEIVKRAIKHVDSARIKNFLEKLSKYPTRYHDAPLPHKYLDDIQVELQNLAKASQRQVEIQIFPHENTKQLSIIAKVPGKNSGQSNTQSDVIIFGAHLDSTNKGSLEDKLLRAPGADDNASGVAVLIEVYRVFLQQPMASRTVEFHFYANEEHGKVGSGEIAEYYDDNNVDVIAYLNLDMVMYPGSGLGNVYLDKDRAYTSHWLRDYLIYANENYQKLTNATILPVFCGPNSDHETWAGVGRPAARAVEADCFLRQTYQHIHTSCDNFDVTDFSKEHAAVFGRLSIAFVLELSNSPEKHP